ncbi:MAG: hypothetical protein ABIR62_03485, partial [Dokdonella sp.]
SSIVRAHLWRLRNTTDVKSASVADRFEPWVSYKQIHTLAARTPSDLGLVDTVRSAPFTRRMVIHAKPPTTRKHPIREGIFLGELTPAVHTFDQ